MLIIMKKFIISCLLTIATLHAFSQANRECTDYYVSFGTKMFWQEDSTSLIIIPSNINVLDIRLEMESFFDGNQIS